MFFKIPVLCIFGAVAFSMASAVVSPGYLASHYALGSQAEHTIRGFGGLSSVSKQAKAVDSAYATVRKTDIRYTNDGAGGVYAVGSPVAAAVSPAAVTYAHHGRLNLNHAYGTPGITHHGFAPVHHAPVYQHGYHHAPAGAITYAHHPAYATAQTAAHHAPLGYGAPVQTLTAARAPIQVAQKYTTAAKQIQTVPQHGGLGISYSPATAVATSTFSGYGVHYGY